MENLNNQQNQGNNGPSLDVNLDALSAPEGGYDALIHGEGFSEQGSGDGSGIPGGNGIPDNLPNLDNDGNSNGNSNPDFNDNDNFNNNQNLDLNNNQSPNVDNYWMKPFEQLKAANPEWDIPQGVNEENYLEVLQQVLSPQPQLHPEIQKIQDAINSGVSFDDIAKQFSQKTDLIQMNDRDILAQNYKHHYKEWSDDKVNEVLDKLDNAGMLEIEAGKLRNAINQERSQLAEQERVKNENAFRAQNEQINAERSKQIAESLDIINKADNIYGLQFSQAEKQDFGQYFAKMVTPDETGIAPMMQALQSNDTLVKIAAMMWRGDEKIRAALTNAKESGKASVLNKLDQSPNTPQRGGSQNDPMRIDFDALAAPERIS